MRRTWACWGVMVLIISALLVVSSWNWPLRQATAADQRLNREHLINKGLDAPIVLSTGRSIEQVRMEIAAMNRAILQEMMSTTEVEIVKRWKRARTREKDRDDGRADAAPHTFTGKGTANGAVLLGYKGNGWWCTALSTQICHAGLWDADAARAGGQRPQTPSIRTSNVGRGYRSVYLETPAYWRAQFQGVVELAVVGADSPVARAQAVRAATGYQGRNWLDTFTWDPRKWYSGKVVWRAYADTAQVDIDGNGGTWVFPVDIWASPATAVVRWWD